MAEAPSPRDSEDEDDCRALQPRIVVPSSGSDGSRAMEAFFQSIAPGSLKSIQRSQLGSGAPSTSAELVESSEKKEFAMLMQEGDGDKTAILSQNNQGNIVGHQENVYKNCIFPQAPAESKRLHNLIASTHQQLDTSWPQGYVETPALGAIIQHLEEKGVCLLLGPAGFGKTTQALQAMARIAADHNMQPVCLERPDDWQHLPGERDVTAAAGNNSPPKQAQAGQSDSTEKPTEAPRSKRYVVVVEDMFGKGNLIERRFEDWEEKLAAMMAKVRTGQVKLIMTSRTHIFQQCHDKLKQSELFQNVGTVQLQEEKYWNESCEIEIMQAFLKQHGVETEIPVRELREAYSCQSIGFPLCCRYFASSDQAQELGVRFFQNPLASLQEDFRALKQSDTKAYFVLILTVMQNGHLSEGFLSDDSDEMERKLVAARKVSGLSATLNAGEIRSKADSLCRVYLTKSYDGDGYRLSHWCLSDCLIVEMCQTNLKLALDVCTLGQLCEYIRTEGCSQSKDAIVHVVRAPQYATLASRIIEEIVSGQNIQAVLRHPCLQDEKFLKAVLENISKEQMDALLRKNSPSILNIALFLEVRVLTWKTTLALLILERKSILAKHLLDSDEMKILPESDQGLLLQEALIAACFTSDVSLVHELLRRKVSVPVDAVKAVCAAQTEKVDLLKTIYQKIAAVDEKRTFFAEAALLCCLAGKVRSLEYLLNEVPKPEDFIAAISFVMNGLFQMTHSCSLFVQGNFLHSQVLTSCFEALTSAGAKMDPSVTVGFAALHQNSFVLEELIKNGAECGAVDNSGMSPLLNAASSGSDACLRVIIDDAKNKGNPIDVNCKNLIGRTPLHVAAERNHAASVNILLQNGADPNAVDNFGMLPLHLCAGHFPNQNLDVLTSLLEKTNNPLHQDRQGKTPLHIAAERCDYSAMKILLDQDAEKEKKGSKKACDVEDNLKMRPLHVHCRQVHNPAMGAEEKRREVEKLLVEKSSDINAQDLAGKTVLHLAAENNDLPLLQMLLEINARADILDSSRATAVHSLCGSKIDTADPQKKKQILKMLLERDVDINLRDAHGRTPLLLAAEADSDLVSILLQHKARIDAADEDNRTVFHFLARHKFQPHDKRLPMSRIFPGSGVDLSLLGKLIRSEEDLNAKDVEGNTALHIAALNGNHTLVEEFIKRGARVDILNNNKQSALHLFCCRIPWNDTEQTCQVFKLLKKKGADLNAQDEQLCTPLHVAALNQDFSAIEALLDLKVDTGALNANDEHSLHMYALGSSQNPYACWSIDEIRQVERQLIVATKKINQQNYQGSTSLHCAAHTRRSLFIKALLDNGADANIANSQGHLALHAYVSAPEGFWDSLEPNGDQRGEVENLLLQKTSSLNVLTKEDESPLHLAVQSGCWTLVSALLDQEANADLIDKFKRKPIHHLASRILPETNPAISLLVEKTKDVNSKDRDENTPIHVAAAQCNLPVAKALTEAGAAVTLHNSKKESPLHLCARAEPSASKLELGKLLLNCGPTVINDQDAEGQTALHIASSRGDISFMDLLLQKDALTDIPNAKGETAIHVLANQQAVVAQLQAQRLFQAPADNQSALTGICKLVVGKTKNANAKDSNGKTSLHLAAESRNLALTEILLGRQANLDTRDKTESLPLHLYASSSESAASKEDDQKLCSLLVRNTKDVNSKNTNGNTPLHLAIDSRNLLVSQSLLEDQRTNLEVANSDKELPIHRFARLPFVTNAEEWIHVETLLLSRTKNVDARNAKEQTPLHLAVGFRNLSFMKLLLENHADLNALDVNQRSPLHLFANHVLLNPISSLDVTEREKQLETLLIEKTHDINKQDVAGWSPLHHAALTAASSLVASLLKGSARTDLVNSEKRTALHIRALSPATKFRLAGFSQIYEGMECDKMLIEKSRSLDVQDNEGKTPLHLALASGNYPVAELLLHNSASVNIQDNKKHLALHILAGTFPKSFLHETTSGEKGTERNQSGLQQAADADTKSAPDLKDTRGDFARLIFQSTEDINSENLVRQTALHLAAATKDFTMIEILLKGKARTDVKDANAQMALHTYAASSQATVDSVQRRQVEELFVSKTQDLNATDVTEQTPLHYAARRDDLHLMQTLLRNGAKTDVPEKVSVLLLYSRRFYNESRRADASEMRELVDDLLVRHADDVDVTDENENTPLHIAAGRDDLHLMETLLKNGASCNLKTKEGSTCLHVYAARSDLWKAMDDAAKSMLTPDHRRNRVEDLLIEKTQEINAQTSAPLRGSPLQIAARLGKLALIEKLLKRNARTDVLDDNNMTPLHIYASRLHLGEVVTTPTLSPTLRDSWLAIRFRVDRLMVERAADINALTKTNNTALHLAAQCDDLSLMEQLLKRGTSADVPNEEGALALHLFAARTRTFSESFKQKRRPVSKLLVEKTTKLGFKDKEGRTPLDLAKKHDDFMLIQLLSDRGEM